MEYCHSRGITGRLATQEISCLLWRTSFRFSVQGARLLKLKFMTFSVKVTERIFSRAFSVVSGTCGTAAQTTPQLLPSTPFHFNFSFRNCTFSCSERFFK